METISGCRRNDAASFLADEAMCYSRAGSSTSLKGMVGVAGDSIEDDGDASIESEANIAKNGEAAVSEEAVPEETVGGVEAADGCRAGCAPIMSRKGEGPKSKDGTGRGYSCKKMRTRAW